jgi:hypothetical protein
MSYKITNYTKEKAKKLNVDIKLSSVKNKKIDVFKNDKKIASVGHINYKDYPTYILSNGIKIANERKRLYNIRHKKDKGINGFYAKNLLW